MDRTTNYDQFILSLCFVYFLDVCIAYITLSLCFSPHPQTEMTIPFTSAAVDVDAPRPKDVGVLAVEVYFPRRVRVHVLP